MKPRDNNDHHHHINTVDPPPTVDYFFITYCTVDRTFAPDRRSTPPASWNVSRRPCVSGGSLCSSTDPIYIRLQDTLRCDYRWSAVGVSLVDQLQMKRIAAAVVVVGVSN